MVIPGSGKLFLDGRFVSGVLLLVFALGTLTLIAVAVGLFCFCMYILNLALATVIDVAHTLVALYQGGDSGVKLVVWLVFFLLLWKLSPLVVKRLRRALHLA